jgi:hypothetical protein
MCLYGQDGHEWVVMENFEGTSTVRDEACDREGMGSDEVCAKI